MPKELLGQQQEIYYGKKLLQVTPNGIHIIEVGGRFGRAKNKATVSSFDITEMSNLIKQEMGETQATAEKRGQLLVLIKTGEVDGVPFRTFFQGRFPYQMRYQRNAAGNKLQLMAEFPVEGLYSSTSREHVIINIEYKEPLTRADWKELDKRKRKVKSEYDKKKKVWRNSFEK